MSVKKRFKILACEIMFREVSYCASKSSNIIDITFMSKGLHDIGEKSMGEKLQHELSLIEENKYDAILLCYGLCNNGIRNLHSNTTIVIPRAHDCITLLMGSRGKYMDYFEKNPGTFFKSPGWIERDTNPNDNEGSITSQLGLNKTYDDYVELYGEDNAEFLAEMLGDWTNNYRKITYIDTGICDSTLDKKISMEAAESKNWDYEEVIGDVRLITNLVNGEWDSEDFLVVPPDNKVQPSNDDKVIQYAPL